MSLHLTFTASLLAAIVLISSQHCYASSAKQIAAALIEVSNVTATEHGRDQFAQDLSLVLRRAYERDLSLLKGDLDVALITNTRLDRRTRFYITGSPQSPAASTLKVPLLARLMHELEDRHTGGRWGFDGMDWGPVARKMITLSDNDAANLLLERYGHEDLNRWLRSLGMNNSSFARPFSATKMSGPDNLTSAADLAKLFFLIDQESDVDGFLSKGSLSKLRHLLDSHGETNVEPRFNDRLNALFPADVKFIHKTGSNQDVLADGGIIVDGHRRYVLVVLDRTKNRAAMQRLGLGVVEMMRKYQ